MTLPDVDLPDVDLPGVDLPGVDLPDLDAVVIGAGAAGLAAAATLTAAGRAVVVVEAGSRIGGRIRTYRGPSGGLWELGAQVVHDRENPVWSHFKFAAGDVGDGWKTLSNTSFRALLGGRGKPLFAVARLGPAPWTILPALADAGRAGRALHGSPVRWISRLPAAAGRIALDWLGQEWAGAPDRFDVPEMLDIAGAPGAMGGEAQVVAGWDSLPGALATGLDVRLSCPARRVALQDGEVVVETDLGQIRAAAAVVAVPPWTVGGVGMELAGMPDEKRSAAASLHGGDAVVAVVATTIAAPRSISVYDADNGYGFLRAQEGHCDIQIVAKGNGAALLRSLLGERVSGGGPSPALSELIAAAFPWSAGGAICSVTVADWGADPFIAGAFTSPTSGRAAHSAIWAEPWGDRVFFAGESTSGARGVGRVHGALASGLRAADELLAAVPALTSSRRPAVMASGRR